MATGNGSNEKTLIQEWSKAQAEVEKAQEALEGARAKASKYAKAIFEAFGTSVFYVKALDRKYRAIHKSPTEKKPTEVWAVIPVPENTPQREF